MIKNMMLSKVYVLFLTVFFSLVVSVLFFGTSSKAASYSKEYLNLDVNWNNQKLSLYCNFKVAMCRAYDLGNGRYHLYTKYNDQYYKVEYYYGSVAFNNYSIVLHTDDAIWQIVSGSNFSNGAYAFLPNSQVAIFDTVSEMESYLSSPDINFDSPFYSSNIVAPNMRVTYRDLSSTPVIDVPLNIQVSTYPNLENEYYVQMYGLINYDENYYVQNTRNGLVYNGFHHNL